ncbi:MAG: hypothetical protein ERJ69_06425 [Aphanocapsa feldmannii 288cV]|nr:MAG: hypothetical protein ERJ69_06425 [Aphanocapsa feldmannii 288cV]
MLPLARVLTLGLLSLAIAACTTPPAPEGGMTSLDSGEEAAGPMQGDASSMMDTLLAGNVSPKVQRSSTADQVALADHLTASGATVYTAYWCHACSIQKELFGKEAVASLDVVECAADGQDSQSELCDTKGVVGYPTWEIKGVLQDGGVKGMGELADLSGYEGDRDWP